MYSLVNYIKAKRRYNLTKESIEKMGGKENCDVRLLVQFELNQIERDYFKHALHAEMIISAIVLLCLGIVYKIFILGQVG